MNETRNFLNNIEKHNSLNSTALVFYPMFTEIQYESPYLDLNLPIYEVRPKSSSV